MKLPLRKPMTLTYDEAFYLMSLIGKRRDDLNRYLCRGLRGQKLLRRHLRILESIQRKMHRI